MLRSGGREDWKRGQQLHHDVGIRIGRRVFGSPGGLSASDIQSAQRNNKIRLGMLDLFRADIELVTGANTGFVTRYDQAGAVSPTSRLANCWACRCGRFRRRARARCGAGTRMMPF